jgi:hypothetical protein
MRIPDSKEAQERGGVHLHFNLSLFRQALKITEKSHAFRFHICFEYQNLFRRLKSEGG